MNRICASAACLLLIASAYTAAAQAGQQIHVLAIPESAREQPSQLADQVVSIHYEGRISASRSIWVRVFREPLSELVNDYPRQTKARHCVVYTHSVLLRVDHEYAGELRVGDLENFFKAAPFQYNQTLTLVFEEGVDPSSNGPLYLDNKMAVHDYFANAVTVPLTSTPHIEQGWKDQAAHELAASQPPKEGFWDRLFGVKQVLAADKPAPAPVSPPPTPQPAYIEPHCQTVKTIPFVAQADNAAAPDPTLEALAPVALLVESGACGG